MESREHPPESEAGAPVVAQDGPAKTEPVQPAATLRPLPSIDVPLLHGERKAARARTLKIAAAVGSGATIVVLALFVPRWVAKPSSSAPPKSTTTTPSPDSPPIPTAGLGSVGGQPGSGPVWPASDDATAQRGEFSQSQHRVGSAKTFRDALLAAGLNPEETFELTNALKPVFDFRRCRPEHAFTVERDASGTLMRFVYRPSVTRAYTADRNDKGILRGRRTDVPVQRTRMARGGLVSSSLGDALERVGLKKNLVGAFVEVFDGKVSFSADTRSGDHFRVLVDEERIGDHFLRYGPIQAVEWRGDRCGTLRAFYFQAPGAAGEYYDAAGRALRGGWLKTPLRYDHISSRFDPKRRHPVLRKVMPHLGVDYAAAPGTPVWAAADGKVAFAGMRGANGNLVSIRHEGGYETGYAHLSRIAAGIKPGKAVKQRQVIGYVGSTGRATGPHLHFGLQKKGHFVDPLTELNGPGKPMPAKLLPAFQKSARQLSAELNAIRLPNATPHATGRDSARSTNRAAALAALRSQTPLD